MDRRFFLTAASAIALAPAWGKETLDAQAVRLSPQTVKLDWTPGASPVTVRMSADPDASASAMRLLGTRPEGAAVAGPLMPRPYYLLLARDGSQTRVAERLLPLEGGRNFRDLGGYRARDGRQVRWGRIYRSGVMAGLTAGDLHYVNALGIRAICDLRTMDERRDEPSPFLTAAGPQLVVFDYAMNPSMAPLMQATTRVQAIDAFAAAYVAFLDTLTPHFTDMFARLVRGEGALAMNCSAGKDRTGTASALILSVLDVPRETVVADYALTQVYTPPAMYRKAMASGGKMSGLTPQQAQAFAKLPPEVLDVIMGSDPEVMRQALARIDDRFGGPVALVKARFGVSDADIARMRAIYLV